ncbi:MAG: glycerophosphodiester phosphodiesterase [Chloroflexota bacterium]|nr:glycerophosphodiester phosphodiesterase [Chloroflexota bacterium]
MTAREPILFAHRGASGYLPENTLPAFSLALEQGATGIESDVWLSADGVPVLAHDQTIRPPGRRIDVTRRTADELAPYGVPRLAELYSALGAQFELSLDIEHPQVVLPMLEVSVAAGAAARLWACHDDLGVLSQLRGQSGEVRLVCSTRPRRVAGGTAGIGALLERLVELPADALNMHWRDWTPGLVAATQEAGLRAFGWDAQTEAAVERLVGLGIDGLYADHPDLLVARVRKARTKGGVPLHPG